MTYFHCSKCPSIISKKYFYNYLNINKSKTKSNEKPLEKSKKIKKK